MIEECIYDFSKEYSLCFYNYIMSFRLNVGKNCSSKAERCRKKIEESFFDQKKYNHITVHSNIFASSMQNYITVSIEYFITELQQPYLQLFNFSAVINTS